MKSVSNNLRYFTCDAFIFSSGRAIFFFLHVAVLGERFHLDGYMKMLSADLKSCGLRQEHGVNSRRIRLMWVCGSSV